MKIKFALKIIFLATALFLGHSCSSDKDEKDDDLANASHTTSVFAVGSGLLRLENMKVYVSETPYKNAKDFKPLFSKDIPNKKQSVNDSVVVNVSNYVGKNLYYVVLRKNLLSDKYHNITINKTGIQTLDKLNTTITDKQKHYQVGIVTSEPANGSFDSDEALLDLTIMQGGKPVANKAVYAYGPDSKFGENNIKALELLLNEGKTPQVFLANTDANGFIKISIPVNERGEGYNDQVFFIVENKKIKYTSIKVNSLNLKGSIQY